MNVAASLQAGSGFVPGRQVSQLTVISRSGLHRQVVHESPLHLEAPNWSPDGAWLLFNSGGRLFRIPSDGSGPPQRVEIDPPLEANNDHVISPDGRTLYFSEQQGGLYAVPWEGGTARRVSNVRLAGAPRQHYLHGISPDGRTLVYVGLEGPPQAPRYGLYTIPSSGGPDAVLLEPGVPVDGPEYSPDGRWIYFNAEHAARRAGHAQICRLRTQDGAIEQLTHDERVNWFPHVSPDGVWIVYLSYPPGTLGHPPNQAVTLRLMQADGQGARDVVALHGGQGTLNVNSWAPDSERFAYVAYPEKSVQIAKDER